MTRSGILACVLAALLAAALIAPAAGAAKARTEVELTDIEELRPGDARYSGKVKSPKGRCKRNRKVTVIHNSNPPFEIGETTTDDNGRWSLSGPLPPSGDKITVKVKKNRKCKGASEVYEIE